MEGVIVDKEKAEKVRKELSSEGYLMEGYKVKRVGDKVYFPVKGKVSNYKIVNTKFEKRKVTLSFNDELKKILSTEVLDDINTSYEVVGDIAILEIDNKKEKKIAEALLKSNSPIKTVVKKKGNYYGKYRLRKHKHLAGVRKKETVHRENGISVKLDIDKAYFSAKLVNERLRIAKKCKKETVLVMFSGVGIYPLVIIKHSKPDFVYGVEINPRAHKYALENTKKYGRIRLYKGDVRKVVPKLGIKFDRIVMPLPKDGYKYLDLALSVLKSKGTIHLYYFGGSEKDLPVRKTDFKGVQFSRCCQVGPRFWRICADLKVK